MRVSTLDEMKLGWFVGDFEPTCLKTDQVEVACKHYKAGESEGRHVHRIATEITTVAQGHVMMNGQTYQTGDVIVLEPGEATDFHALDDAITVVVKLPSVKGDKYPA
jgi:quercetin dioxygenase-like cupin family protein